jgi:SAM-dependent methyltransferase
MNPQLLDYLVDPNDGQPLELHVFEGSDNQVREAALVQPQSGRWYPVRDAIPSLFVDALRIGDEKASDDRFAARFQKQLEATGCKLDAHGAGGDAASGEGDFARIDSEKRARDEQAEDYDRMLSLKVYEWIETPAYRKALRDKITSSAPLFEAGCGTGRFTGLFSGVGAGVAAVDMSRDSILRNRIRHAGRTASTVHYIHADLTHLPLNSGIFGSVAHCGVYEHIPSQQMRTDFLKHAVRALVPNGSFLLSAYRYGGLTKMFCKEVDHAGGIPFKRFTEDELRSEVEPYFNIEKFRANLGVYMSMIVGRPKA